MTSILTRATDEIVRKARLPRQCKLFASALLLLLGILWLWPEPNRPIQVAVAKGGRPVDHFAILDGSVNQTFMRDSVLAAIGSRSIGRFGFLHALPLGPNASKAWPNLPCRVGDCAQVTLYDYEAGGTLEAIVDSTTGEIIRSWTNAEARPGASSHIVPRALAIAGNDEEVIALLGDMAASMPMMIPMSTWLMDGSCEESWCLDLTYLAPDSSGRILHILVNMEEQEIARIFYSRGRLQRSFKRPAAQGPAFENGCHEAFGWRICWEMTAHDGINFYDATYNDQSIFSSAKISQVEVFYPSWPGGYRDEIGYASSVPPHFGTHVTEFDDGFEIRQLYTEFLRWPNCICCYRYEQIIRFFSDGSFEPEFISHGPGCDDLSSYRPFWRIDLDLGGTENSETWFWDAGQWTEATNEIGTTLFSSLSPDGEKLHMASGDTRYVWRPVPTDPLGLDEGRLFVIRWHEQEGLGPVAPGPADSFWPPAQWLDRESLVGENVVVWYIPILKTKQQDPWWCMPDPEPEFSPCHSLLRIQPVSGLSHMPLVEPTPATTRLPSLPPTVTRNPMPTVTPRPIPGRNAEEIVLNAGCGSCHAIGPLGEAGKVGPDLSNIGLTANHRVVGKSAREYLRQSILEPGAFLAPSCPNGTCIEGIMPDDYGQRLTGEQIETLIDFLLEQKVQAAPAPALQPTLSTPDQSEAASTPSQPTLVKDQSRAIEPGVPVQSLASAAVLTLGMLLSFVAVLLVGARKVR